MTSTYEKWSLDVPEDFRFSIKLSKEITHSKDLESGIAGLDQFMRTAGGIGDKKGCLLIQFPGKITLEHFHQVEQIMKELELNDPHHQWKKALEFRNPGWYIGETWEMLDEYDAAVVLHDIPKAKLWESPVRADHVYIRFHGMKGDYRDSYPESFLNQKALEITRWLNEGKEVYVYFNNTIGSAFENAVYLSTVLGLDKNERPRTIDH